jgi:1-acyl-sn-glycerol-3-phosphate acyltransferase
MNILRSSVFTIWAAIWTLLTAPLVIAASLLLRGLWGYHAGKLWRLGIQFGVEHFLGIRPRVVGLENMPQDACLILSKHQSAWETMTLQDYVPKGAYCVFVLKKELLRVPLIGWGLGAMKMISIDRSAGKEALDLVVEQGRERLKKGFYVIIFPEGTRVAPGRPAAPTWPPMSAARSSRSPTTPASSGRARPSSRSWAPSPSASARPSTPPA